MYYLFLPAAKRELDEAVGYYALHQTNLAQRFRDEVKAAARRITEYPTGWPIERGDVRKCLLHRFPYKLLYAIEEDHILILAVAHQHRKPDYWIDR